MTAGAAPPSDQAAAQSARAASPSDVTAAQRAGTAPASDQAAAQRARAAQDALTAAGERPQPLPRAAVRDPLPFCIYATVALLAWVFSPGLVAAVFAVAGVHAYARAFRAGLRKSDCVLGDPRLVMLYLALIAVAGLSWTAWRLWHLTAAR